MKLHLKIDSGAIGKNDYQLDRGKLLLGRAVECTVRFVPETREHVSRRHALINKRHDGFYINDQNSTYGTWLNQHRVSMARLVNGDVIVLGRGGPRIDVRIEGDRRESRTEKKPPVDTGKPSTSQHRSLADITFYNPLKAKSTQYEYPKTIITLGIMAIGVFFALLMILLTFFGLGFSTAMVGLLTAFIPAPFYLMIWLWLDRYDPEPPWALAAAFAWGAGVATFISYVAGMVFGSVVGALTANAALVKFLSTSISAPVVEEACKGIAVVLIFLLLRREFDGILDGIVYAGVVALGFATVENVIYYGQGFAKGGSEGLFLTFFFRGILGPFTHAVFTSMIGIGCGIARETHHKILKFLAPVFGYLAAVTLHFLWNTLAGASSFVGLIASYVFIWGPLFIVFLSFVVFTGFREVKLIRRLLVIEVSRGLITQDQLEIICSWIKRLKWLASSLKSRQQLSARRRFLSASTRLALSYWHMERAAEAGEHTISATLIPKFRREITRISPLVG